MYDLAELAGKLRKADETRLLLIPGRSPARLKCAQKHRSELGCLEQLLEASSSKLRPVYGSNRNRLGVLDPTGQDRGDFRA